MGRVTRPELTTIKIIHLSSTIYVIFSGK